MADHIHLLMLRGLNENWKQCIGYYVGTVNSSVLPELIKTAVTTITNSGFHLKALSSDQGSINRSTFKKLGATTESPTIVLNDNKIACLYDAPHLIKSVRNCLLSNDILIDGDRVSWSIILRVFKIDCDIIKAMHKLSEKHVMIDNSFGKLSVKAATQVFSNSVAACILTCVELNYFKNDTDKRMAASTADFISKMNKLFDNLNSVSKFASNPNKCALSDQCPQILANMLEMKEWIKKWIHQGKMKRPFCFDGLIQTINGIIEIWNREKADSEQLYIITSHFNQDPTENLISMLRNNRGSYEVNPSPLRVSQNLKQICFQNAFPTSETSYHISSACNLIDVPNVTTYDENETDFDSSEKEIQSMVLYHKKSDKGKLNKLIIKRSYFSLHILISLDPTHI